MEPKTDNPLARELAATMLRNGIASLRRATADAAELGVDHVVELHTETARVLEKLVEQLTGRQP